MQPKFMRSGGLNLGQKTAVFRTKELKRRGKVIHRNYQFVILSFSMQLNDFLS